MGWQVPPDENPWHGPCARCGHTIRRDPVFVSSTKYHAICAALREVERTEIGVDDDELESSTS